MSSEIYILFGSFITVSLTCLHLHAQHYAKTQISKVINHAAPTIGSKPDEI